MPRKLAVFLVVIVVSLVTFAWRARAHGILRRWAAENDLILNAAEYCWIFKGPFTLRPSNGARPVFRIIVTDRAGAMREGHARLGGFLSGLLIERVEVAWGPFLH